MERWRMISGCPAYEVSDLGRVRSKRSGDYRLLQGGRTQCRMRYVRFTLIDGQGKKVYRNLHILVLQAFVSPRPTGKWGLHKDGNVTRNKLSNLYWGTPLANGRDRVTHGNSGKGECNPTSVLTEEDVVKIRKTYRAGSVKQSDLAEVYGVKQAHISRIVRGESWSHVQ